MLDRKIVGAMLLLLASCGCRACTSCTDNLPPVLDGPYSHVQGRAGSAFTGGDYELTPHAAEPNEAPAEEITPTTDP